MFRSSRLLLRWLPAFALLTPTEVVAAPEADDGFEVEEAPEDEDPDVAGVEGTTLEASPGGEPTGDEPGDEAPEDDGDWDFEVEDISDDAEALAADLKGGEVQATGKVGTLAGVIVDTSGEPIPGAYVEVVGKKFMARAGIDGTFSLTLPPGTYTVVVREELHKPVEQAGIKISARETTKSDFSLAPQSEVLVVTVEADANVEGDAGVMIQRQNEVASSDRMSRVEMSRSGGGTANVARFIVGATVVDGRFVFVRGLGHRYGNTLLDGARVPSPEPDLRTVPLDIFPSGALGAINVQKSFTPDVPGDFAGGSIQLVTREIPSEPTVSVGIEAEGNSATTFRPMLHNVGFPVEDFFGFGNIPRGLPSNIPAHEKIGPRVTDTETFLPRWTPEEAEAHGEAFYTDYRVRRGERAPMNGKLKMTVGDSWRTRNAGTVGALVSAEYKNKHQTRREITRVYAGDGATGKIEVENPQVDFVGMQTTQSVAWSAIGLLRWDLNDNHRIEFNTLYSRDAEDETREQRGTAQSVTAGTVMTTRLRYIARSIWFNRLGARHRFPTQGGKHRVELDYFGTYSAARRDEPGVRSQLYIPGQDCLITDSDNNLLSDIDITRGCDGNLDVSQYGGAAGNQLFTKLKDENVGGALNLEIPFDQWSGLRTSLKFGGWVEGKRRDFGARRFNYKLAPGFLAPTDPNHPLAGTGNVINDDTIGGGVSVGNGGTQPWAITELTNPQDNYRASQSLYAGYGMLTLPFARWVKLSGGARLEFSEIDVRPYDLFADPDDPPAVCVEGSPEPECLRAGLTKLDVLPAASLIFSPGLADRYGEMNLRLMGSQTVARPEFRELAPFQFTNFVGGFTVRGNEDLQQTSIWNAEARWEWFPRPTEVVAVTGFYKYFESPIEQVANASTPTLMSFVNARAARNAGFELEVRKSLGFLADKSSPARKRLSQFGVGSNFAYVYSRVDLHPPCYPEGGMPPANVPNPEDYVERPGCKPEIDAVTSRSRALQGQSPYVFNVFVDYNSDKTGTFVRVLLNTFGRRIFAVSTSGLPDIYEEPVPSLDLVFSQRLFGVRRSRDADLKNELRFEAGASNLLNPRIRRTQDNAVTSEYRRGVSISTGIAWTF